MKNTAYIGLGANVGDCRKTLNLSLQILGVRSGIKVRKVSNFVETAPVGGPAGQGKFLNAAAEVETSLTPQKLLLALNEIESACGRNRAGETRWGPRSCDLDILLFGGNVVDDDELMVPHPRLAERLFALAPLAEIAPDAVYPLTGKTVRQMYQELLARGESINRPEFRILDYAVNTQVPLADLASGDFADATNKPGHGLSPDHLADELLSLMSRGKIAIFSLERKAFVPDRDEILQAFENRPPSADGLSLEQQTKLVQEYLLTAPCYCLTENGGQFWESYAQPEWNKFVTHAVGRRDDGAFEITACAADGKRLERLLRWFKMEGLDFDPEKVEVVPLTKWQGTYWRNLPVGRQARFVAAGAEARDAARPWWVGELFHWYNDWSI